jgi:hypothetical protein
LKLIFCKEQKGELRLKMSAFAVLNLKPIALSIYGNRYEKLIGSTIN